MNGDAQIILNKIIEIETKQEEWHIQNKSILKELKIDFKDHCKTSEKFRSNVTRLNVYTLIHSGIILCVIYALIKAAVGRIWG